MADRRPRFSVMVTPAGPNPMESTAEGCGAADERPRRVDGAARKEALDEPVEHPGLESPRVLRERRLQLSRGGRHRRVGRRRAIRARPPPVTRPRRRPGPTLVELLQRLPPRTAHLFPSRARSRRCARRAPGNRARATSGKNTLGSKLLRVRRRSSGRYAAFGIPPLSTPACRRPPSFRREVRERRRRCAACPKGRGFPLAGGRGAGGHCLEAGNQVVLESLRGLSRRDVSHRLGRGLGPRGGPGGRGDLIEVGPHARLQLGGESVERGAGSAAVMALAARPRRGARARRRRRDRRGSTA